MHWNGLTSAGGKAVVPALILALLAGALPAAAESQAGPEFWQRLGFGAPEVSLLDSGKVVVRALETADTPIIMLGVVRMTAVPENFVKSYSEVRRRVNGTSYLAAGCFSDPPTMADLASLTLEPPDIAELRKCVPGDCSIQLPAEPITAFRARIDWNAPDAQQKATEALQRMAFDAILAYRSGGNRALGAYLDRTRPGKVEDVCRRLLSRAKYLPDLHPEFRRYLLEYPRGKPQAETDEFYYWEKVRVGQKHVFRINHVIIYRPKDGPANSWIVADKQLYSNRHLQTAIDLWFCVPDAQWSSSGKGIYLVNVKSFPHDGTSGFRGRIARYALISKTQRVMKATLLRLKENAEESRVRMSHPNRDSSWDTREQPGEGKAVVRWPSLRDLLLGWF